jgi:hypothetical protein
MATFKNKITQKFISFMLILAILAPAGFVAFSKPQKASAVFGVGDVVIDPALVLKEVWKVIKSILKSFLSAIVRKLLDKITQSTINWINGGFQGKPSYVQNTKTFFNDIKKEELKNIITTIGYDKAKFPFGKDYALGLIDQTKNTFEKNATYSLSQMYSAQELAARKKGFDLNLFLTQGMYPQNNFLGFDQILSNEVAKKLSGPASEVQKVKDDIQKGMGFMSQEKCNSNPAWDTSKLTQGPQERDLPSYLPPNPNLYACGTKLGEMKSACETRLANDIASYNASYQAKTKVAKDKFTATYSCPEGPAVVTPGSVVGDSINKALGSKTDTLLGDIQWGNYVGAIVNAAFAKLFEMGLSAATKAIVPEKAPKIDDFNYFDLPTEAGDALGIPTISLLNISVEIVNDNDGTMSNPANLQPYVDGIATAVLVPKSYAPGLHTVSMDNITHYSKIIGGDCARDGTVTLDTSGDKTCKIYLDDIPKSPFTELMVDVVVVNTHGGTVKADDIPILVDNNIKASGVKYGYAFGDHTVSETRPSGYSMVISGNCRPDGSIHFPKPPKKFLVHLLTGAPGGLIKFPNPARKCTITNYDIPNFNSPNSTDPPKLTVELDVINDNKGKLDLDSVKPLVDGNVVENFVEAVYTVGVHKAYANNEAGYTMAIAGDCAPDGSVSLALGDIKFCTITLDDE